MTPTPPWAEPRTAIVTGGGSGIGLAISRRLAEDGAAVAIFDLDGDAAGSAAAGIEESGGRRWASPPTSVTGPRSTPAWPRCVTALGAATILVNNAGISPFEKFLEIERESLERVIAVNVIGTFDCCQAVAPDMIAARWGRIVNIASSSAQTGSGLQVHYSATKGGVIALTRSLALALGSKGITVNAVPPSLIDTPPLRQAEEDGLLGPGGIEAARKALPVRRVGTPEDLAAGVAFLARDDAGYVTGQVLGINGGRVMQ